MEQLRKIQLGGKHILAIVTTLLGIMIIWYALVGMLFLYVVEPQPYHTTTCDMIQRINGQLYCMALMQAEDDDIMVARSTK